MKGKRKAVLMSLCAIVLVVASVMGTMAYLTAKDEVKNTFTIGKVDIELDEAKIGDDGKVVYEGEEQVRVKENDKYHLYPGCSYVKDPTVRVKEDSEACYVRMFLTCNKAKQFEEEFLDNGKPVTDFLEGYDLKKWLLVEAKIDQDTGIGTYEFRYYRVVEKGSKDIQNDPLFSKIKVPTYVDSATMNRFEGMKIDVMADAIQASGFDNDVKAWEAADLQKIGN